MEQPRENSREVLLVGVPEGHTRLLRQILERRYAVCAVPGALSDLPEDLPASGVVIAGSEGLKEPARQAAMRLRTESFVWQPIVLLVPGLAGHAVGDWSIQAEEIRPNLTRLYAAIDSASPVSTDHQAEVVRFALLSLWDDLAAVAALTDATEGVDVGDLRHLFHSVLEGSGRSSPLHDLSQMLEMRFAIEVALGSPRIGHTGLAALSGLVVDAEAALREAGAPQALITDLHKLSNAVRFSSWKTAAVADHLRHLHHMLSRIPLDVADRLHQGIGPALSRLRDAFLLPLKDALETGDRGPLLAAVRDRAPTVETLSKGLAAVRASESQQASEDLRHILVIEDDVDWRTAIVGLLRRLGLSGITKCAGCLLEAREMLKRAPKGTLVLVDLGLPETSDGDGEQLIELDAGLRLMGEFADSSGALRFIVLTSLAKYSDAVREALAAGVDPWDYIQKGPKWQDQLASRVRLAMAPRAKARPRVQVLQSTARLIHVDRAEVALDQKPYIVLEYLASRAPHWCSVDQMRADLTTPGRQDITPPIGKEEL